MVLLNVALMCTTPLTTFFRIFFLAILGTDPACLDPSSPDFQIPAGRWNPCGMNEALHRLDALLGRDHLARALPGPRVGLGALAARREALAVAQPPVAADFLQTVDVLRDGPFEVALGRIARLDDR